MSERFTADSMDQAALYLELTYPDEKSPLSHFSVAAKLRQAAAAERIRLKLIALTVPRDTDDEFAKGWEACAAEVRAILGRQ